MSPILSEHPVPAPLPRGELSALGMLLRIAVVFPVMAAVLFGCAGRFDLPALWAYMAMCTTIIMLAVRKIDPGLRRERLQPGPGGIDRNFRCIAGPFIMAHMIVACLDVGRLHWSDTVPMPARILGFVLAATGMSFSLWAMTVNRFFSPVVRIQSDRGHHLITDGPYRYLRHPGYAGLLIGVIGGPLALGSWWALAPSSVAALLVLRRTIIEDRFLLEHLEGYREFAKNIRYRLLPGVW